MKPGSDSYEETALVYIRLVRKESEEASAAIEQIHAQFGSHAALRAALIITLLRMEVKQNHWTPNLSVYAYLFGDYPAALPLIYHAMTCCLVQWAVPVDLISNQQDWKLYQPVPGALPSRDLWHPLPPGE